MIKNQPAKKQNVTTYVKICPKCKSTDISIADDQYLLGIAPVTYTCKKCGYGSPIFPEVNLEEDKKTKNIIKGKKTEDEEEYRKS
jgi:hypothetical protein